MVAKDCEGVTVNPAGEEPCVTETQPVGGGGMCGEREKSRKRLNDWF